MRLELAIALRNLRHYAEDLAPQLTRDELGDLIERADSLQAALQRELERKAPPAGERRKQDDDAAMGGGSR